jgi:ribosomal protein S18 acetylase RimI-like enzyme
MPERHFAIRPARDDDRGQLASLFAAVAGERDGIAAEPPVDVARRAAAFELDATIVATVGADVIGGIWIDGRSSDSGEIGMLVARDRRGRGVGTALVAAAIEGGRERGLHKLSLGVFPHNDAAIALYRKPGFEVEGLRRRHIRRASGELWDLVEMDLLVTEE